MESSVDVGVDIGKRRIAIGWPDLFVSSAIDLGKPGMARDKELRLLADWMRRTLPNWAHLWIEEPYLSNGPGMNQSTTIGMAETVGAIKAAANWAEVTLVGQSTWKAQVCGSGRLQKLEVADWLAINRPVLFEKTFGNEDQIDAMCIGLYGKMRSEGLIQPPIKKPRKKRKLANKEADAG